MLPVGMPFRDNQGSAASTLLARRMYGDQRGAKHGPLARAVAYLGHLRAQAHAGEQRAPGLIAVTHHCKSAIGLAPPRLLLQKHFQFLLDRPTNQLF